MTNNHKIIKSILIIGLLFLSIFVSFIPLSAAKDPLYNADVYIDLKWSDELLEKPVVPRTDIVELELTIILEIKTGPSFGGGLLEGYAYSTALVEIYIEDTPSWCYATLKAELIEVNISNYEETSTSLHLIINENAPAYGDGFIKIRVVVDDLGLIKGNEQTFTLPFQPAYFPMIKTNLPETNTKRIDPSSEAVFPIEIENAGNAETLVFFEVENVPEGWSAVIPNSVFLDKTKGSKKTVYLIISPSSELGYHYDEATINVKITPTLAEHNEQAGSPIYATFIVQNRGFSSSGTEFYLPMAIIIIIILAIIFTAFKRKRKKQKT